MREDAAPQQAAASQTGASLTEADQHLQGSVGPLTNLAHLAEFHPDLAFQEYTRRQNSAPDNIHTPLKANRQANLAKTQSRHGAESHARANFEARAATVRKMNAQRASGQQEYDVGMFATEEPSYMPCGISRKPYTRPVADFDASNILQYQRPSHHQPFWKRIVSAF